MEMTVCSMWSIVDKTGLFAKNSCFFKDVKKPLQLVLHFLNHHSQLCIRNQDPSLLPIDL